MMMRRLPETTAKGIWPCWASMCSSDFREGLSSWELREVEALFADGEGVDGHVSQ